MKRHFRLVHPGGLDEVATISTEPEAVTVTRRVESTRSKGRPVRIPIKLCQGGSVELEARVQQQKLVGEGFTFDRDDETVLDGRESYLYLVVHRQHSGDVIDHVTGSTMPPGIQVGSYAAGRVDVSDSRGTRIALDVTRDASAVSASDSPLAALALIWCHEGWAELALEVYPTPGGTKAVDHRQLYELAQALPEELRDFVLESGVARPGLIGSGAVAEAVLL